MLYSFVSPRENHTRMAAQKNTERWVRKSNSESNRSSLAPLHSVENKAATRRLKLLLPATQAASENLRILCGNFARAQITVGMVPGAYPVDGPGDGKRHQLGIARPDRAISDPLLNIAAKSRIQAPLHVSNLAPGRGRKL